MKTKLTAITTLSALLLIFNFSVFAQSQLSGVINYHNDPNKPIEDVLVSLYDDSGNFLGSTTTNVDGEYTFYNLSNGTYTIEPTADFDIAGDGMQDAFMVLMHILGFNTLTGFQFIAGDINEDNQINMVDYVGILIQWLIYGNPPPGEAWEFESITTSIAKDSTLSSGGTSDVDVDGSWSPGVKPLQNVYANYTESTEKEAKESILVPVNINTNIPLSGINLVMEYPASLVSITNITSPLGELNYSVDDNLIRVNWLELNSKGNVEPVIYIEGTTSKYFVENKEIVFNVLDKSHMIDSKGHLINNVELEMPTFTAADVNLSVGDIYPNPTTDMIHLDYKLETSGNLSFEIYGINGQRIAKRTLSNQMPGVYKETLNIKELGLTPGFYSMRIGMDGAGVLTTKKIVVCN